MIIITKVINCPGCNFANTADFLAWHESKNGTDFKTWLEGKNTEGKLVYTTTTVLSPERVENTYVFSDQAAADEYHAKIAETEMDNAITNLINSGEVIIESVTSEEV